MSTFPTSPSVGGEKAVPLVISKHPRKATPWGGETMERSEVWESALERRDRTLTLSLASSSC